MAYDDVVIGAGHNGLTAAAYLARAGRRVLVLERSEHIGGAAVSVRAFKGVDARISRYAYLVSLLPRQVIADLVLGSRYTAGGGTENWGLLRRIVSRGGSMYAQVLLGVRVRDLTGGFKCFRRATLEAIDLDAVSARGYGFQIETTYRVLRAGLRVREIPIRFVDRRVGDSKMTGSIVVEAMLKVPLLRLRALTGKL